MSVYLIPTVTTVRVDKSRNPSVGVDLSRADRPNIRIRLVSVAHRKLKYSSTKTSTKTNSNTDAKIEWSGVDPMRTFKNHSSFCSFLAIPIFLDS